MDTKEQAAKERAALIGDAIKGFVERKVAPVATEVAQLKAREETHFQTIESLLRRIEALERTLAQKSGALRPVRIISSGDR